MKLFTLLVPGLALAAASADTCGDITCSSDESCCKDSPTCTGECTECCVDVSTYCVAPRPGFLTSTCCSRWTVACTVGSVGCCDPARPWQELGAAADATSRLRRKPTMISGGSPVEQGDESDFSLPDGEIAAAAGTTAYALFTKNAGSGLQALTIDAASGKVLRKRSVSGAAATYLKGYYGESTRLFPWDGAKARWVFADLDRAAQAATLRLYTIDAATGGSEAREVVGCGTDYPMGQAWDAASQALLLGSQDSKEARFCSVDADSAEGTALGAVARGAGEADAAYYAAYISHAHAKQAYRVGRKLVQSGQDEGVAVTSPAQGKTSSWLALSASGHGLPVSVHAHPAGGLVGLAPRTGAISTGLDVMGFDAAGGPSRLLATLENAHLPRALGITLGYVGADVAGETFGAMAVQLKGGGAGPGLGDKWAISTLGLGGNGLGANATNATTVALAPQPSILGAETVSLSGFGLAGAGVAALAAA